LRSLADGGARSRWDSLLRGGYVVVLADYRAGSMTDRERVLGAQNSLKTDVEAVLQHLATQRGDLDPARLYVTGGSLGGMLAMAASATTGIGRALVLDYPASTMFLNCTGGTCAGARPNLCVSLDAGVYDRPGALAAAAPLSAKPVLILQGSGDGLCSPNVTLAELLRTQGAVVTYLEYANERHLFTNDPAATNFQRALDDTLRFLGQH
jgi:acetyl esterase/lipase